MKEAVKELWLVALCQPVQKYFSILTICMAIRVWIGEEEIVQHMSPPIPSTQFSLVPFVAKKTQHHRWDKRSTSWIKGPLFILCHVAICLTPGKGEVETRGRKRKEKLKKESNWLFYAILKQVNQTYSSSS
jgi:hypothetical protein